MRSLGGFLFGLFLASVYGMTALFVQNQGLWYCVYTTIAIAFLTAFGMGLSIRVRANVMLMMPMLCSSEYPIYEDCFNHTITKMVYVLGVEMYPDTQSNQHWQYLDR